MEKLILYRFLEYDLFEIEDEIGIRGEISSEFTENNELIFLSPLQFLLNISKKGSKFLFEVSINTLLQLICDRCLEKFEFQINTKYNFLFIHGKDKIEYINGKMLNIKDLIMGDIYLNIPYKKLCNIECKGLCPVCGTNLNIAHCNCKTENVLSPFSKLQTLIK